MVGVPARRRLHFLGSLLALAFCAVFLYASVPWWYEAWHAGQTTASIWRARLWIPYLAVPAGLALLCAQYLAEVYLVASGRELPFGLAADDRL
jgi:TRAP-type C4-dicarboxylate transport system permease small subunit